MYLNKKYSYTGTVILAFVVLGSVSSGVSLMLCPRGSDYLSLIGLASEWMPPGTAWEIINMTGVEKCPGEFAVLSGVDLPMRIHLNESDVEEMVSAIDGRWYRTWWRLNGSYYQSITVVGDDGTFDSLVSFFYRLERKSTWHVSNHSSVRDMIYIDGSEEWIFCYQWGENFVRIEHSLRYNWQFYFKHYRFGNEIQYSVEMSGSMMFTMSVISRREVGEISSMLKRFTLDVSAKYYNREYGWSYKRLKIFLDVSDATASTSHAFSRRAENTTTMSYLSVDTSSGEIVNVSMRYNQVLVAERSNGQRETYTRSGQEVMEAYGTPSFDYKVFWRAVGENDLVPAGSTIDGPVYLVVEIDNRNRETNITITSPGEVEMESDGVRYRLVGGGNSTTISPGKSNNVTLGMVIVNTTPANLSVRIPVKLTFVARGMVKGMEEYRVEREVDIIGNVYIPQQGPALVLEYIEHAALSGRKNAWEDKLLYFEPVSVIKFGFGVIRNDGGVAAKNVSVWMVFGNSTHNWTVGMWNDPFDVSAGSKSRGLELDELDLGNESMMGGVIVDGSYFIEFRANYSYIIFGRVYYVSASMLVETIKWGENSSNPKISRINVTVQVRPAFFFLSASGSKITIHITYDGHVRLNVTISVYPVSTLLFTQKYPPPDIRIEEQLYSYGVEGLLSILDTVKKYREETWDKFGGRITVGGAVASVFATIATAIGLDTMDAAAEHRIFEFLNSHVSSLFISEEPLGKRYKESFVLRPGAEITRSYPVFVNDECWYDRDNMLRNGSLDTFATLSRSVSSVSFVIDALSWNQNFWLYGNGYRMSNSTYQVEVEVMNSTYNFSHKYYFTCRDMVTSGPHPIAKLRLAQKEYVLGPYYGATGVLLLDIGLGLLGVYLAASASTGIGAILLSALYGIAVAMISHGVESINKANRFFREADSIYRDITIGNDPHYNYTRLDRILLIDFPGLNSTLDMKLSAAITSANRSLEAINALAAGDINAAEELSRNASRFLAIATPLDVRIPPTNASIEINSTMIEMGLKNPVFSEINRTLPGVVPGNMEPMVLNITTNGTVIREDYPVVGRVVENGTLAAMNESAWQLYFDGNLTGAYEEAMELYRVAGDTIYGGWAMRLVSLIEERFIRGVAVNGTIYAGGRHGIRLEFDHPTDMSVDVYAVIDGERRYLGTYEFHGAGMDDVEIEVDVPLECEGMEIELDIRSGPVEVMVVREMDIITFNDAIEMARAGIGKCSFGEYLLERAIDGDLLAGFVLRRLFPNTTLLFYMICGRSELYPVAERLDGNVYLSVLLDIYAMTGNPWIERILEEAGVL